MPATTRREALRQLAAGGAAAVTAPLWVDNLLAIAEQHGAHRATAGQAPAAAAWAPKVLSPRQNELVMALAELIVPATDTPGATDAEVNQYIDEVLAGADPADRERFIHGLEWIEMRSERRFNRRFVDAPPDQQVALLTDLSSATDPLPDDKPGVEFFRAMKGMTVTGYYTSRVGILQEIGHDESVFYAEFKGCTHKEHM